MSNDTDELETIPELDLRDGVRGKYYERYMQERPDSLPHPDAAIAGVDEGVDAVSDQAESHDGQDPASQR